MAAFKKAFRNEKNEIVKRLSTEIVNEVDHLHFQGIDGSEIIFHIPPDELVCKAAMLHGFSQKLGDTFAGKSLDEGTELLQAVIERMHDANEPRWVEKASEAGPSGSDLSQALVLVAKDEGIELSAADAVLKVTVWTTAFKKAIASEKGAIIDGKLVRAPNIFAKLQHLKAQRALARATKAEAEAGESSVAESSLAELLSV